MLLSVSFITSGGLLLALAPSRDQLPTGNGWSWLQADPERALVTGLACAAWLLAAYLFVVAGLSLLSATSSTAGRAAGSLLRLITPLAIRRILQTSLGLALAVGPAGAAVADTGGSYGSGRPAAATSAMPVGLAPVPTPTVAPAEVPLPDLDRPPSVSARPPKPSTTTTPAATSGGSSPPATHTVVPGDTLWDLAAARLPPSATPAEITKAWERWYSDNRTVIGSDPSLILPGQVLVVTQVTP